MQKKQRALLALGAVVVLCGVLALAGGRGGTKMGDPAMDEAALPDSGGEAVIADEDVPLSGQPVAPEDGGQTREAYIDEVLAQVNAARTAAGLAPLEVDDTLCAAAAVRAKECQGSFSHTRPDGSSYQTALRDAGNTSSYTGENLAIGHTTAEQVMKSWLDSEGHKANILGEHYTKLGVGRVENTSGRYKGYTWVQLFAS